VDLIPGPINVAAVDRLKADVGAAPQSLVVVQLAGHAGSLAQRLRYGFEPWRGREAQRSDDQSGPAWLAAAGLRAAKIYSLPNGRGYALLERNPITQLGGP
jgi:hypothetical protein